MAEFSDKVVIVTGGGSGAGAATARAFAEHGANVAVFERNPQASAEVQRELARFNRDMPAFVLDVADFPAVDQACRELHERFGGIDVLVNNAAIAYAGQSLETLQHEEWQRFLDVNLTGPFNCIKAALAGMRARGGGAIVNIASLAAKKAASAGSVNYTASKAGLLGLTRQCAVELAIHNIRVNAICPGFILTPMLKAARSEAALQSMAAVVPAGRLVEPEDIADVVLFLAGDRARMCTGIEITVDGGIDLTFGRPYSDYFKERNLPFERSAPFQRRRS